MAGRCTECGQYHYDGPPCDNCGEMGFTEAPKVMECAECGEVHFNGNPPCNACGEMGFRRVRNPEEHLGEDASAASQKDEEPDWASLGGSTNRRSFLYVFGSLGALGAGYYAYSSSGSDSFPTMEAEGEPEEAAGIDFSTVEKGVIDEINDKRASNSEEHLERVRNVDAFAEYWIKHRVGNPFQVQEDEFNGKFNVPSYHGFTNRLTLDGGRRIEMYESELDLEEEIFGKLESREEASSEMLKYEWTEIGIDIHVGPEGDVYYAVVFA